ncbi:MAG TPA: ATP-binding protein [Lysobacter sp.]|nr:ATP-binding protein [Lysobacter sp.]
MHLPGRSPPDRRLALAALAASLILLLAGGLTYVGVRTQQETAQRVVHTHEVIEQIEALAAAIASTETTQRGYLLTGDLGQLQAVQTHAVATRTHVARLRELTRDNASQQRRMEDIRQAIDRRLAALDEVRRTWDAGRRVEALESIRSRSFGEATHLARLLDAARAEEGRLLEQRLARAERAAALVGTATIGTSLLAIALLAALYSASRRYTRRLVAEQDKLEQSREQTRRHAAALEVANARLEGVAEQLEVRVERRTRDLAEANAELEGFARTIAHDLRAPLRNIEGYASALIEDEAPHLSADGAEYTRRLVDSTRRLDRLITDLLAYSRLARTALEVEDVQLGPVVRQALADLAHDIDSTGARIDVATDLPAVRAHALTLQQVVVNLLSNAIRFVAPERTPEVRIGARREGSHVVLSVSDNGIGIAPEHRERIFQVFERLHSEERYPGTGIGLAIVRKGVERMGGRVDLHSEPGRGSRFDVYLPAATAP